MQENKQQQRAIAHNTGPALILAGPGSGKTFTTVERVRYLIEVHHADPSHILVIAFTKAAARQMRDRFFARMDNQFFPVTFGTFHAVFFHILKTSCHYNGSSILKEKEKREYLRAALLTLPKKFYAQNDGKMDQEWEQGLLSEIGFIKNIGKLPADFTSEYVSRQEFMRIFVSFQKQLAQEKKLDLDDFAAAVCHLFRTNPAELARWQREYSYLLVDEFQDINSLQYKILQMLAAPVNNLFIVGDDDQSIYHFRGARPEIMLNFTKDYPKAETVLLNVNYRCSKNILRTAMEVIGCNTRRFKKQLDTPNEEGMPVTCKEFDNPREEYMCVVAALKKRMERGEDLLNTAILLRTNQESEGLINVLMEYQVPFTMKEQLPNLFRHWICRALLAYLEMAAGDRSRKNFLDIMNRPNRYISREALNSSQINFNELREYYKDKDWMCDRITTLETHLRILGTLSPFAAINFIRKGMGFEEYLREYAQYRKIKPEELLETLDRIHESAKGMKTLAKWQAYIEEYTKRLNEQARKQQDKKEGVTISTLHAVKGLEYDIVYILNVNEGSIPYRKAVLAEAVEEERRLFYVGMTRAKKKLVLAYVKRQYEKEREPSRFLEETGL